MRYLCALLCGLSSGCASTWVEKTFEPKAGVVRYLDEGAGFVISARRKDAESKMAIYCSPSAVKLIREMRSETQTGAVVNPNGFGGMTAMNLASGYVYLQFRCE